MISLNIYGCITCNRDIQEALYNSEFLPNLLTIISGFIVLAIIVILFAFFSTKKFNKANSIVTQDFLNPVPLSTASIVMGLGIGGFIDGILFHQIFQLHGMVSNKLPIDTLTGKSVNMFWDGIFHALTLTTVIIGFFLFVKLLSRKDLNPSPKLAVGGLIGGWGIFNLVEGLIHHQLLQFHNVNEYVLNKDLWNYTFLASGLLFIVIGWLLIYHRDHFSPRLSQRD